MRALVLCGVTVLVVACFAAGLPAWAGGDDGRARLPIARAAEVDDAGNTQHLDQIIFGDALDSIVDGIAVDDGK